MEKMLKPKDFLIFWTILYLAVFSTFVFGQGSNLERDAGSPCYETDADGNSNLEKPQVRLITNQITSLSHVTKREPSHWSMDKNPTRTKEQSIKERVPKRMRSGTRSFYRGTRQERMPLKSERNEAGTDASSKIRGTRKKERFRSFCI